MSERNWQTAAAGEIWNPISVKNADGTKTELKPTGDSVIEGYYLGGTPNQGKDQNTTVHDFMVSSIGGKKLDEEKKLSVFGSHVLDDRLSKVRPGMYARVQWLGKKAPKTASGRPYQDWDVKWDSNDYKPELVGEQPMASSHSTPSLSMNQEAGVQAASVMPPMDIALEDDLPF